MIDYSNYSSDLGFIVFDRPRLLSKRTKLTDFPRDNHAGNLT